MSLVHRVAHAAVLSAAVFAATERRASACSCLPSGPPCQALFSSDAVFVGTMQSIEVRKVQGEHVSFLVDRRFVHLSIERTLRGVQATDVIVATGSGGGDCGYDFKVGQR